VDDAMEVNGICVNGTPLEGEGEACSADAPCARASGLACNAGLCAPAWTIATFEDEVGGAVPGAFELRAAGLAHVRERVVLHRR
jgi:hypothetical protein